MKQKLSNNAHVLGWAYYAFQLTVLPSLILAAGSQQGWDEAQVNFGYYVLNFTACILIFRSFLLDSLTQGGANLGRLLAAVVIGFCGYYGCSRAFATLMPEFSNVNDQAIAAMLESRPVLMFLGLVLLAPLAEECFYRGLMFTQVTNRFWGYCVSTLAFAAVHVVGYIGSHDAVTLLLCFAQYIPAGLILAASCHFTGTIFAPILIHTAVNAVAFIEMY